MACLKSNNGSTVGLLWDQRAEIVLEEECEWIATANSVNSFTLFHPALVIPLSPLGLTDYLQLSECSDHKMGYTHKLISSMTEQVAHFQTHLAKADGFAKSCDLKNRAIAQTKSVLECGTDVTTSGKAAVHLKQWQLFKRLVSMLYCNCIRTQNAFHERRAKSSRKGCFVWSRVALARVEINQWDRVVTVDLIGSS